MRRTHRVPLFGEVIPEAAAEAMSIALWGAVATVVVKTQPALLAWILALEWHYLFVLLILSVAIANLVVRAPLSYFGLIHRDESESLGDWQ